MYHFYQSEDFPKGVYRVCSAASYRAGLPDWEVLFSVADFDEILGDDVYLDGVSHYVEQPLRVLLSLSAAGGDAAYTLEFDLAGRRIVENGFHFPAGKTIFRGATKTACGSAPPGTIASSPNRAIRARCGCSNAVRRFQTACPCCRWRKTG